MNTVIFNSENAAFKFDQKEVRDHLIGKKAEYAPGVVFQSLKIISTGSDKSALNLDGHNYFGFVVLDLINTGIGTVTCEICKKIYAVGQLTEFVIGHGKSPFDIKQKRKGGFRLFGKRKNPSMFGGKGYKCPAGHELIAIETWKT